ncbi:MAG: 16S rRNA (cytosine(967)-C(5))-methyltransferase RsmB [Pseudomonadales bacterium]
MATQTSEYHTVIAVLLELTGQGKALDTCLDRHDASPLVRQICYGVTREYFLLEAIVQALVDKPIAKKHADIHLLLLAGIYSIRHLHRPEYASVDRVVASANGQGKSWARGLINGVLRNYIRRKDQLDACVIANHEAATNHPAWLLDRIEAAWPEQVQAITAANNSHPPMTLRVNRTQTNILEYSRLLDAVGIEYTRGQLSADALMLTEPTPVTELPGFEDGLVSVQDEASQLAAPLLDLHSNARVLDACAAPGGKTCHMLELQPDIDLLAIDADETRAGQISSGLSRLGLDCAVRTQDLLQFASEDSNFDRILLDVPCSATGIIRRHPDIKLLRRDTDIDKLSANQLVLLEQAWQLLGENGILLYSTCSILPEENDAVISAFVSERADVELLSVDVSRGLPTTMGRQLLPETGGWDGFFYAKIRKMRSDR